MPHVFWLIRAQRELVVAFARAEGKVPSGQEYRELCRLLAATFPDAAAVIVRDRLHGFRNRSTLHILLVEVVHRSVPLDPGGAGEGSGDGPAAPSWIGQPDFDEWQLGRPTQTTAHIVKIGPPEILRAELTAWERHRPIGLTHHSILMALRQGAADPDGTLRSIIYEDAQHVLGGSQIVPLEHAMLDFVRWGTISSSSLGIVIESVFSQLDDNFYVRSYVPATTERNAELFRQRLANRLEAWLEMWRSDFDPGPAAQPERLRVRREVLGFLSGKLDSFMDPMDYLQSVVACPQFCPLLLWGCAHGDLHGRNILVNLTGLDATLPALYDYEEMSLSNLVGWDFVKLETELKVRALPLVFRGVEGEYIKQVYLFEQDMAARTQALHDRQDCRTPPSQDDPTDRLKTLVLAIRNAAREHMGVRRNRDRQWLEEYYFLLACYGVDAGRYGTYQRRNVIAAYISAGVAARRLTRPRYELQPEIRNMRSKALQVLEKPKQEIQPADFQLPLRPCEMSHHARLGFATVLGRSSEREDARNAAARLLEELREQYPHVLEVEEELVLLYLELGKRQEAEELLQLVSRRYNLLSEEMLCRFGRSWKDQGAAQSVDDPGAARFFEQALHWYLRAYEIRNNYYPGINVATLYFVLGDSSRAAATAQNVLVAVSGGTGVDELAWIQASQAEAHLLLANDAEAEKFYRKAVEVLSARDRKSTCRQVILILKYATEAVRKYWDVDKLSDVFRLKPIELQAVFEKLGWY
jgi:tetratricopeptide (TPR) repeat protein